MTVFVLFPFIQASSLFLFILSFSLSFSRSFLLLFASLFRLVTRLHSWQRHASLDIVYRLTLHRPCSVLPARSDTLLSFLEGAVL